MTVQNENQVRSKAIRGSGARFAQLSRPNTDTTRLVREAEPAYAADRVCFICGHSDETDALVGSTPLCDWVHPACLTKTLVWD